MPTPAQAGAAVATAGVLSAGSYGIYHYTTSGEETKQDDGKGSQDTPSTFEKVTDTTYFGGLLSIRANRGRLVDTRANDGWWNKVYKERYQTKAQSEYSETFNKVTEGFLSSTVENKKGLNQACQEAITLPLDTFRNNPQNKLLLEIEQLCTGRKGDKLDLQDNLQEPTDKVSLFSNTLASDYASGKVIGLFKTKDKFVKAVGEKADTNTEKWWTWSFTKRFNARTKTPTDKIHDVFKLVTKPYSADPKVVPGQADVKQEALNQACDAAYKLGSGEFKIGEQEYLVDNIVAYCAKSVEATKDLTEPTSTNYTEAKADDYKLGVLTIKDANAKKLVDATAGTTTNDLWFKWAFEKRVPKVKTGLSSFFSGVTRGVKGATDTPDTSLKTTCDNAYKKDKHFLSDDNNKLLTEIGKFCASDIFVPTLPTVAVETEPANVQTFASDEQFTEQKNKDYKGKVLSLMKKANLPKIVKYDHLDNRSWWDWAFKELWDKHKTTNQNSLDTIFTGINKGYSDKSTEEKALNQACHKAYKQEDSKYLFGASDFLLKNIGQFCTKGTDTTQKDVSEPDALLITKEGIDSEYSNGIFKSDKTKNISKLVKPVDDKNKLWWKWAYETIYQKDSSALSTHFVKSSTKVTKDYSAGSGTDNVATALNLVCKEAYKKTSSALTATTSTPTIYSDVQKFCTPKGITLDTLN